MAMDGLFLRTITNALNTSLVSGRIQKVVQCSQYEILLLIRVNQENKQLLFSIHPENARIGITTHKIQKDPHTTPFIMRLKKYIEGSIILSFEQVGFDRTLKMHIQTIDVLSDKHNYTLILELMGRHSNLILTSSDMLIIDCAKRAFMSDTTSRSIIPHAPYKPLQQHKKSPLDIEDCYDTAATDYEGISTLLQKEMVYQHKSLVEACLTSTHTYLYLDAPRPLFYLIPLTHLKINPKAYPLFEGIDVFYQEKDAHIRLKQHHQPLLSFIDITIKKLNRKLLKLQSTYDQSLHSEDLKVQGDLLYAHLHLINKGDTQVCVDDYYTGDTRIIVLDPKKSAKANAQSFYTRYKKSKQAIIHMKTQIDKTNEDLAYFDTIRYQVTHASIDEVNAIKQELNIQGYLKQPRSLKVVTKQMEFTHYQSLTGISILVGKHNIQNDLLTFKIAHKSSTWLHVQNMPGAHVVIQSPVVDDATLELAGMIAAYYSKAVEGGHADVDYTLIKHVKKRQGGKPGHVVMQTHQTFSIDIDKARIERALVKPYLYKLPKN